MPPGPATGLLGSGCEITANNATHAAAHGEVGTLLCSLGALCGNYLILFQRG